MGVVRPTGSLPPRVYWVRRLLVLVLLAAVVLGVVLIARALTGGGDGTADPEPEAPAPSTSTTTEAEDPAGPQACAVDQLGVTLAADAASYPGGALPTFTLTLVNNGTDPCLVDAGDAQRDLRITSGSDAIWASQDCAAGESLELLLAAGQSDERQVQWSRTRSAAGCPDGQAAALPGTYQATLTLAGASAAPVVFVLE
ncbi:hypothetical protein [Cellulomonas hominis]